MPVHPRADGAAYATERGPVTPPVAFHTPHATKCRERAPATSYTRPAPSHGKRVERAGRVAMPAHPRADGGIRNRERPCHTASSVPHSPRHQMPREGASHLLHAAGALSRQKGRASGQIRDVCAPPRGATSAGAAYSPVSGGLYRWATASTTLLSLKSLCGGGVPSSHPSLGVSVFFLSFAGLARTGTNTGTPREPPKRLLRGR